MKFYFNGYYFLAALLLLIVEIVIGSYMHDDIIRPYGGDFLVVILLYCILKSVADLPVIQAAFIVLMVAFLVEISQYFHLVKLLGVENSKTAVMLLGTSFSFTDLLMYTLGTSQLILIERLRPGKIHKVKWKNTSYPKAP